MKIIIPMAGIGKRMRPHTLTVPKPLLPIAGKPIVQRLVEDIAKVCGKVDEVSFITGRFGEVVETKLIKIAKSVGAEGKIYYQDEALGTAHAIYCAEPSLSGNVVVAFADTLFRADFTLDSSKDGVIWVQKVTDPRQFGVVKLNDQGTISDFIEKPQDFVSDLAIIGIYYFRDGDFLKKEIKHILDNDLKVKGEYQLTDALENMRNKGASFVPGTVSEWLDCGNKDATVDTNSRYLEFIKDTDLVSKSARLTESLIIPPVFIGENVEINNSIIGPHVSIGNGSKIGGSIIKTSIIQENALLENTILSNSMIGNSASVQQNAMDLSLGDYNVIKG